MRNRKAGKRVGLERQILGSTVERLTLKCLGEIHAMGPAGLQLMLSEEESAS